VKDRVGTGGPTTKAEINIFNGLLFDQEGNSIVRKVHNTWRPYYFSSGAVNGSSKDASHLCFPANQFDHAVLLRLCHLLPKSGTVNRDDDLKAIDGRIEKVIAKLEEFKAEAMKKPLRTLMTMIEAAEGELNALERQRQEVLGEMAAHRIGANGFAEVLKHLDRILKGELSEAERLGFREIMRVHISRINVAWFKGSDVNPQMFNARDYVCGADVLLSDGSTIEIDFNLKAINYRKDTYNKANPYELSFLIRSYVEEEP
jgi:hypothetical protein